MLYNNNNNIIIIILGLIFFLALGIGDKSDLQIGPDVGRQIFLSATFLQSVPIQRSWYSITAKYKMIRSTTTYYEYHGAYERLRVVNYAGYSGHVHVSNNADRLGEYSLWHKPRPGTAIYEPLLILQMTSFHNKLGTQSGFSAVCLH